MAALSRLHLRLVSPVLMCGVTIINAIVFTQDSEERPCHTQGDWSIYRTNLRRNGKPKRASLTSEKKLYTCSLPPGSELMRCAVLAGSHWRVTVVSRRVNVLLVFSGRCFPPHTRCMYADVLSVDECGTFTGLAMLLDCVQGITFSILTTTKWMLQTTTIL